MKLESMTVKPLWTMVLVIAASADVHEFPASAWEWGRVFHYKEAHLNAALRRLHEPSAGLRGL